MTKVRNSFIWENSRNTLEGSLVQEARFDFYSHDRLVAEAFYGMLKSEAYYCGSWATSDKPDNHSAAACLAMSHASILIAGAMSRLAWFGWPRDALQASSRQLDWVQLRSDEDGEIWANFSANGN